MVQSVPWSRLLKAHDQGHDEDCDYGFMHPKQQNTSFYTLIKRKYSVLHNSNSYLMKTRLCNDLLLNGKLETYLDLSLRSASAVNWLQLPKDFTLYEDSALRTHAPSRSLSTGFVLLPGHTLSFVCIKKRNPGIRSFAEESKVECLQMSCKALPLLYRRTCDNL